MILRLNDSRWHSGALRRANAVLLETLVFGGLALCAAAAIVHDIGRWTGFW